MKFSILGAVVFAGILWVPARPLAQSAAGAAAPPDFSGVYYPMQEGRGGGGRRGGAPPAGAQREGPPPRPTQSAPLSDGSQGRSPDAPSLTPAYFMRAVCPMV